MNKITVVGSGASGVHFALSLLKKGYDVEMLDVGYSGPPPVNKDDSFNQLKDNLADPVEYFLGKNFESVIPTGSKEVYEFPPNKQFIFKIPEGYNMVKKGFEPHISFARGGLAEAWTGGSYPFNDSDLEDYPFNYNDIEPYYSEISERIGLIGADDDMVRFFPKHKNLLPPMELDMHSQILSDNYDKNREKLNKKYSMYFGRSRIATLSKDLGKRKKCDYSGRCQWGCPSDSIYVPSITLKECLEYKNFRYIPGILIKHFNYNAGNKIESVTGYNLESKKNEEFKVDVLALAAGTLSSSKIFLDSVYKKSGKVLKLSGLMDNRQVLAPFINFEMIGKQFDPDTYQYHQLAVGMVMDNPKEYVHGQITTLKTGLMQPPFQSMPLDFKTAIYLGRHLHAALGVVNLNFCDSRRKENYLTIEPGSGKQDSSLELNYVPPAGENKLIKLSLKKFKKFFSGLGVIIPLFQAQSRPMGASVHYSGTLPMDEEKGALKVSPNCRSYDFKNLFLVDGTSFPFLPAKNLTFTLMANAARVADKEF